MKELNKEKENALKIFENTKIGIKDLQYSKKENEDILNPTKNIFKYKDEDVLKVIEYAKDLQKEIIVLNTDNYNKDMTIKKLAEENNIFKNNKEFMKKNKIIKEQRQEITRLNKLVDILENNIEGFKKKINELNIELKKWLRILNKVCCALDKSLGRNKPNKYLEDYEGIADSINYGWYNSNKNKDKDNFER